MLGHPLRLRQILVNLEGKRHQIHPAEIVLGLDVDVTTAGPIPIRLGVRNSGIGIPVAQRSRIFQHFTEAASSSTP
jgi:signal transduction histidine kinase